MIRKYPTIRIIFDQNIFQNNMDQKLTPSKRQPLISINIKNTLWKCQNDPTEVQLNDILENLSDQDALDFLDSLKQNNHHIFCRKAQLYLKLQDFKSSDNMCKNAFQFPSECTKFNELLLTRKLPMLKELIQKFTTQEVTDPNLFKRLKQLQKQSSLDQRYHQFYNDLNQGGAQLSKLTIIQDSKNCRSVYSRTDIAKEQTILYIPKKKLILFEQARQSLIVKKIHHQKIYLRSPKHSTFAILLLEHKQIGVESPYYYYIKHFPTNFQSFPINFRPKEYEYLKGSSFIEQIQQRIIDIKRDYDAICSVCPNFSRFDLELIVSSRIFGISIDKRKTDALVPLADMLNHNDPKQTSWYYSDQMEGFIIKSIIPIAKGEQIYDSYGSKCNSRFLLNYGFTIASNDSNEVIIKIPFQFEQEQKIQTYRQITLRLSRSIQSRQFQEVLSTLRYSVAQPESKDRQNIEQMKQTPFINFDIEGQIWQKLQKILQSQISGYPTSIKQDKKLLQSKQLSINERNCIILRMGQKQILHYYLTMSKKIIKYFKSGCTNFELVKEYQSYLKQMKI